MPNAPEMGRTDKERNYYAAGLNATNLARVYETSIPRVARYLEEEIAFVRRGLHGGERVLEVAAGYGRIMRALAADVAEIDGIDISPANVAYGEEYLEGCPNCRLLVMDVHEMRLMRKYDVALCLQNGLSAVKGDASGTVEAVMGTLRPGGRAYFSTYSDRFWEHRLRWFVEQSEKGLLGEIDYARTGDGKIVCVDGFTATTFGEEELRRFGDATGCPYRLELVDESSLFLIIEKPDIVQPTHGMS